MEQVYWVIDGQLAGRIGPMLAPWDLAELWGAGFRTIISLSDEVDREEIVAAGFRHHYFAIPPVLALTEEDTKVLLRGVRTALPIIQSEMGASRPVLVHCHAGKDRTGVLLAAYLMRHEGRTADEAIAYLRSLRPDAMSAPGYEDAVYRLDAR